MTRGPDMTSKMMTDTDVERADAAAQAGPSPLGIVHCFVEREELRRMLAAMATAELASVIVQSAIR